MTKPLTEYVDKVIDIIQKGWTKGTYARTVNGRNVATMDKDACQFCLEGALARAADGWEHVEEYSVAEYEIREAVKRKFPGRGPHANCCSELPAFNDNDSTTVDDVVLVLTEAKKRIQEQHNV